MHRTKSELFQKKLRASHPQPRAGLADTIEQARSHGYKLALVTTTSADNVTALADALRPQVDIDTFDLIVDTSSVEQSKPDPAAYRYALERLGEDAREVVAIEDNVGGRGGRGVGRGDVHRVPGRAQRRQRFRRSR